jgi:hypothetical protein
VLAYGQQWALAARRFLRAGDSPHPLSSSLFLQKSAPVPGQSQTVFIKTLALRVYAFLQSFRPRQSVAWGRHLPGDELRGCGERKGLPRPKKTNPKGRESWGSVIWKKRHKPESEGNHEQSI